MHESVALEPGSKVQRGGKHYVITHNLGLNSVLAQDVHTGKPEQLEIAELQPITDPVTGPEVTEIALIDDQDWREAQRRFSIVRPLQQLGNARTRQDVETQAKLAGVHAATIYRWLDAYEATNRISSLLPSRPSGGKGKSRLDPAIEKIMTATIEEFYLHGQQRSVQDACTEVLGRCLNAHVEPPHPNTIRSRIAQIADRIKLERRSSAKAARDRYEARPGHFTDAQWPLSVVQIDHTKLDIVLVDDVYRRPVGRPWITLAIDVFSRMVAGFYVSFDPPSALAVGLCVAHAILPKEQWMTKLGLSASWPCWGIMRQIHTDNGREFRGHMLSRACEEYGIELCFRPVKVPHFGGHIERLIGTVLKKIHTLPGTTFSNPKQRAEYKSDKHAAFTLSEFEKWLSDYITGVYHQQVHSGIGTTPLAKYEEGILGTKDRPGVGLPSRLFDGERIRLDFMPIEKRTIQTYGVMIDGIHYYSDVLRRHVNATEPGRLKAKREFIFKRDPRDISTVYFFDPDLHQYFAIPFRDTSHPVLSLWELREVRRVLDEQGRDKADERAVFEALERLRTYEEKAVKQTTHIRRSRQRRTEHARHERVKLAPQAPVAAPADRETIAPFEDIEPL